jgi:hypothetical protein
MADLAGFTGQVQAAAVVRSWRLLIRRHCPWRPAGAACMQLSCLTQQVCTATAPAVAKLIHHVLIILCLALSLTCKCTCSICSAHDHSATGSAVHATVRVDSGSVLAVRWTADAGGAWVRSQVRLTAAELRHSCSAGARQQFMLAAL